MLPILAAALAIASIVHGQTTTEIVVTESSTQSNPIQVSSRPTDDVPNLSDTSSTSSVPDTATIPIVISEPLPTISTISNHIGGNNTSPTSTVVVTGSENGCVTVTMEGEPMFTIQTDTVVDSPCTYTVYGGASGTSGNISSAVLTTTSTPGSGASGTSNSTTAAPASETTSGASESTSTASQTDSPANRNGMGAEALGLVAFIGALGIL